MTIAIQVVRGRVVDPVAGRKYLLELPAWVNANVSLRMPGGCWRWMGEIDAKGYGRIGGTLAHLAVLEVTHKVAQRKVGAVSGRMLLGGNVLQRDHLCRDQLCVRPAHGEWVTNEENQRRRHPNFRLHACPVGHDLALTGIKLPRHGVVCADCCVEGP